MTDERKRILQLVQDGKLTVEQADLLMQELEKQRPLRDGPWFRNLEKPKLEDLKQLGNQVSAAVSQSLGEVRRSMEQQWDSWNTNAANTVAAVTELRFGTELATLFVETRNGRIQVSASDEPSVRIHIRGQVKTDNVADAKRLLESSLQKIEGDGQCQLSVLQGGKDGVVGANIDIYVPREFAKLVVNTHNGSIHVDDVRVGELQLDTQNGAIWLHDANAMRARLSAENGSIQLQNSVTRGCKSVYVNAKNGRIMVDGIAPELHVIGSAQTVNGKMQITGDTLQVEYDENTKPASARFEQAGNSEDGEDGAQEVHLFCETRNGDLRIRA